MVVEGRYGGWSGYRSEVAVEAGEVPVEGGVRCRWRGGEVAVEGGGGCGGGGGGGGWRWRGGGAGGGGGG